MASDQTPIEKMAWEWLRENHPYTHEVHDQVQKLAAFAAHVEAQRPGKVLTNEAIDLMIRASDITTHMDLAQCVDIVIRKIRDNGYLAPAQSLSVDKIMEVYHEHEQWFNLHGGTPAKRSGNFKARLNKLIG